MQLYFTMVRLEGPSAPSSVQQHPTTRATTTPPSRNTHHCVTYKQVESSPQATLAPKLQDFSLVIQLTQEALSEGADDILELGLKLLADGALLLDGGHNVRLVGLEVREEVSLPLQDLGDGHAVEVTVDTGEDKRNHLGDGHGGVLLLLEELGQLQRIRR